MDIGYFGHGYPYLLPFPVPLQHNVLQQSHNKLHTQKTINGFRQIKLYDSDPGGKDVDPRDYVYNPQEQTAETLLIEIVAYIALIYSSILKKQDLLLSSFGFEFTFFESLPIPEHVVGLFKVDWQRGTGRAERTSARRRRTFARVCALVD